MRAFPVGPRALAIAAAVAVVLAGGLLAAATRDETEPGQIRLLQFNMCGHVCRYADADKVAGAVDELAAYRPDAASLVEVCRKQFAGVRAGLRDRGWPMDMRFLVTQPDGCYPGDDYGIAVLTRPRIRSVDNVTYVDQDPGNPERRGLVCVSVRLAGRRTHVCSTHIVDSGDDPAGVVKPKQIAEVAARMRTYRTPVVLMGDFNLRPSKPSMSRLYSRSHGGGAHGEFAEVAQGAQGCRCGTPTIGSGAKYDYVFVSAADFAVAGSDTARARYSDHVALRGRVDVRTTR